MCSVLYEKTSLIDTFPVKNSLKQVLVYAIRRVQEGQGGLIFNGSRHFLVYVDGINWSGEILHERGIQRLLWSLAGRWV